MNNPRGFLLLWCLGLLPYALLHAQWVQTNGPLGGEVRSIRLAGGNVFAAAGFSGAFRSAHGGGTWTKLDFGSDISWVSQFTGLGNSIFAITDKGIFRSSDGGFHWGLANTMQGYYVWSLLPVGTDLFAGTNKGIYRSSDKGSTWRDANAGLTDSLVFVLTSSVNYLYAGTRNGVFRSMNGGTSWTWGGLGLPLEQVNAIVPIGMDLFCSIRWRGVFRSTDYGVSWGKANGDLVDSSVNAMVNQDTDLIVGTDEGVSFSSDGGRSWRFSSLGREHPGVMSLQAAGSNLYAGTRSGGIYVSTDKGATWQEENRGFVATRVYRLASFGPYLFAGTPESGVYRSSDSGITWDFLEDAPGPYEVLDFGVLGTSLFLSTTNGIVRTIDNGTHWQPVETGSHHSALRLAVIGNTIFAAFQDTLRRSTDGGLTWIPANTGLQPVVYALRASGTRLFAGGVNIGAYRSLDSGKTWQQTGNPDIAPNDFACIGDLVLIGHWNGVARSTDGGTSWTAADSNYSRRNFYAFAVAGSSIFAATFPHVLPGPARDTLLLSTDGGVTWRSVMTGGNPQYAHSLAVHGDYLCAGTEYSGVWRRPLREMLTSAAPVVLRLPEKFNLERNYPNPFNPTTTIGYSLPHRSHVTLTVFNTLGQQVAELVNGEVDAGHHEIRFNASNLASGVYFYLMRAGGFTQTRSLCVVR